MSNAKLVVWLLTISVGAFGQQNIPVTAASTFYDVEDANERAFVEFSKNSTKKLIEALMKEDAAIRTATLTVRLFGGNPAPVGRYRFVIIRDGFSLPNPERLAALAPKAVGMSYDDYMKKATSLRKRTGQTLRQRLDSTSGARPVNLVEGDIIRTDLMKISTDRATDYVNMERNDWLPMHSQRVKDGTIKSWSLWTFRSPLGSERRADAITTTVYKDLNAAMANPQYNTVYTKVFPDRSMAALSDRTRTVRTIVSSDLWRVIWSVSRQ
jgi:hypothetical protein